MEVIRLRGEIDRLSIPESSESWFTKSYQYEPDGTLLNYYEYTRDGQGRLLRNDKYQEKEGELALVGWVDFSYNDQGERLEMCSYNESGELTDKQGKTN